MTGAKDSDVIARQNIGVLVVPLFLHLCMQVFRKYCEPVLAHTLVGRLKKRGRQAGLLAELLRSEALRNISSELKQVERFYAVFVSSIGGQRAHIVDTNELKMETMYCVISRYSVS